MRINNKGFTIIEVVLVLAIAGLIFVMVFVALPTLQRNQRNEQRKEDVGRVVTAITNWQAASQENRFTGSSATCTPTSTSFSTTALPCKLIRYYLNDNISDTVASTALDKDKFRDPSGNVYNIVYRGSGRIGSANIDKMDGSTYGKFGAYVMVVTFGSRCDASNASTGGIVKVNEGPNYFTVRYRLEGDESKTPYCRDNSE